MYIPQELQFIIVSFTPFTEFKPVCKNWNNEINNIQKTAANIIGKWYTPVSSEYTNIKEMVRYYVIYHPPPFFITHPEFIVDLFALNKELLTLLSPVEYRKRSDIRDWMMNMPIILEDWDLVNW